MSTLPTAELMTSRFLYNADSVPADLTDDRLIRGESETGTPYYVNANEYMTQGGAFC